VTGAASPEKLADLVDAIVTGDALTVLNLGAAMLSATSAEELAIQLASYLRSLVVVRAGAPPTAQFGESHHGRMKAQAAKLEPEMLLGMGQVLVEARRAMREVDDASLVLDLALLRLSRWSALMPLSDAVAAVRQRVHPGATSERAAPSLPPPAAAPRRTDERAAATSRAPAPSAAPPPSAAPAPPPQPVNPPTDLAEGTPRCSRRSEPVPAPSPLS
jgi:DNA polymerase III gamma/tau subunit